MSTTGHRDVATLEALTYQASHQLSTSATTVDIHFRFDKLLINFIFQTTCRQNAFNSRQNSHQTLFSNNKIDRIRCAQTIISLNASTRCENFNIGEVGIYRLGPLPPAAEGARPSPNIYMSWPRLKAVPRYVAPR